MKRSVLPSVLTFVLAAFVAWVGKRVAFHFAGLDYAPMREGLKPAILLIDFGATALLFVPVWALLRARLHQRADSSKV